MHYTKLVTCDTETWSNYFLIMFRKLSTGEVIYFDKFEDGTLNRQNILHILNKYTIITFNGLKYDQVMIEAACQGFSTKALKKISDFLIVGKDGKGNQPWQARKRFGVGALQIDQIDLIEVAPLKASLNIYAGRIHSPFLEDLTFPPEYIVKEKDLPRIRKYCGKDNFNTELLFKQLEGEIELRIKMSKEYGIDLRSKSDAQIAEAVIKHEIREKTGSEPKRPKIKEGTEFLYKAPDNLEFETPVLQNLFKRFTSNPIVIDSSGYTSLDFEYEQNKTKNIDDFYEFIKQAKKPTKERWNKAIKSEGEAGSLIKWLKFLRKKQHKFVIGSTKYTAGIGGLHSCEKSIRHVGNENIILRDYDVASFYPRIILNNKLTPEHIGETFLHVYDALVEQRLKDKKIGQGDKLKIVINGSFGKLGSKWSCLYAPDLMAQVTITGQLSLLMLIERLELARIPIVSANTDGIVVKMKKDQEELCNSIVEDWEFDTEYKMESTDYASLNSRDVNCYIGVKKDGVKGKGAYADQRDHHYKLRSNPGNDICSEAVRTFLQHDIPVEETINACDDITKFLTLRTVNGSAVKDGVIIGKAIRWYYGSKEMDAIFYNTNGNTVPKSQGGVPLMDLPKTFPTDVDFPWYINEAKRILKDIGYK